MVGVRGFEPPASTSRTWRASQTALHPHAQGWRTDHEPNRLEMFARLAPRTRDANPVRPWPLLIRGVFVPFEQLQVIDLPSSTAEAQIENLQDDGVPDPQ